MLDVVHQLVLEVPSTVRRRHQVLAAVLAQQAAARRGGMVVSGLQSRGRKVRAAWVR